MRDCVAPHVRVAPDAWSGVARTARNENEVSRVAALRGADEASAPTRASAGFALWRRDE
jgi:hypothetical protein